MTNWLLQSTSVVITFGPFLLNTDGVTLVINLVGTGANQTENTSTGIRISKNGGALTARHATATASTYDAFGNYLVTLDTTDTGTLGLLRVQFADSAHFCPVWQDFMVVPANIYNAVVLGTDILDSNVQEWNDTTVATPATAGIPDINVKNIVNVAAALDANNLLKVDTEDWHGGATPAPNTTGVPLVDDKYLLGTIYGTPATAGVMDVNVKNVGNVSQTGGDIYPAVTNIAVTSAALNATASSRTITTGSGAGGVANTTAADGVYDNLSDTAGTLDFYYQFDISGTVGGVAVGVEWLGYLIGIVNTVKVYAYNWGGASWDQIGTIIGIAGAINATQDFELTSAHTSAGLVRIRFQATGLTTATLKTDRILVGYAVVALAASAYTAPDNTSIAAIKVQTDKLAFGVTNQVDTNVKSVNGTAQTARDLGLALPAAAPQAAGGLITSTAGSLDLDEMNVDVEAIQTGVAAIPTTDNTANISAIKTQTDKMAFTAANQIDANVLSVHGTAQTAADLGALDTEINADVDELITSVAAIPTTPVLTAHFDTVLGTPAVSVSADIAEANADTDEIITTLASPLSDTAGTTTLLTRIPGVVQPQTGDSFARIGVNGAGLSAIPDSTTDTETAADVDELITTIGAAGAGLTAIPTIATVTNLTNAPTNGDFTATMKASLNAATPTPADSTTLTEIGADVDAIQAKTDQLTFTIANQVDANALSGGTNAAAIRAAIGMASANLDTQLAEIEADVDLLPTAVQVDTQLSGTHGAGAWGPIGSTGTYTITVTITDANNANPLQAVLVTTKDSTDIATLDQQRTSVLGVVTLSLNTGTYQVHLAPVPGYSGAVHTLVVAGNAAVAYTLTPFSVGSPSAMNLCRVYGYEYLNGNPLRGRQAYAQLANLPHTTSGAILEGSQATTTSDLNGYWFLDLVIGQEYRISVGESGFERVVKIPNQGALDLSTLI